MYKFKHTTGPWWVSDEDGQPVLAMIGGEPVRICDTDVQGDDAPEGNPADAALIRAAPELVAVVTGYLAASDPLERADCHKAAHAVLAKIAAAERG